MARYGSKDLKIEVDNSGGSLVDISDYVTTIGGFSVEAILEEGTAFSDTWVEQLFTGNKQSPAITLGGFYDDTASTGPDVILNSVGDTRSLKITLGSTKSYSVEAIITSYSWAPAVKTLTKFSCVLTPTGTVTLA